MAEETAAAAAEAGDPAAVSLALTGASRVEADAYLRDQRLHIHEQLNQIHLDIWEKRLGVMLRAATMAVGVAVAAILLLMAWSAGHSNGLLVEPLSVPPDLAQRGMTGEVVAAKLLDQLTRMQTETNSARAAQSYANDWGQSGLKLDIPETGVSFKELDAFLHEKLGHDTHITGEVVHSASGISVTARVSGGGAETVAGPEAGMDALVEKSAEAIYRLTQPFRYGMYLASHDRVAEARTVFGTVAKTGPRLDRAWAYPYWALVAGELEGIDAELKLVQQALAEEPDNIQAHLIAATVYDKLRRPEEAIRERKATLALLSNDRLGMYSPQAAARLIPSSQAGFEWDFGAFRDSALHMSAYVRSSTAAAPVVASRLAGTLANAHDLAAARAALADMAGYRLDFQRGNTIVFSIQSRMMIDSEAQDWGAVLADAGTIAPALKQYPGLATFLPSMLSPLQAYALARTGNFAAADAGIAATPADCYDCLIARARIAELEHQPGRADAWFARAVDGQKSIPFAYADWGRVLLERGNLDAAIAKFAAAAQRGPHFADAWEGWGEALMARNQSHLALAKFAQAQNYAPNWGRLHLKWGEALAYAGKKAEADKHFARAAQLALTPAETAELHQMSRPTGS